MGARARGPGAGPVRLDGYKSQFDSLTYAVPPSETEEPRPAGVGRYRQACGRGTRLGASKSLLFAPRIDRPLACKRTGEGRIREIDQTCSELAYIRCRDRFLGSFLTLYEIFNGHGMVPRHCALVRTVDNVLETHLVDSDGSNAVPWVHQPPCGAVRPAWESLYPTNRCSTVGACTGGSHAAPFRPRWSPKATTRGHGAILQERESLVPRAPPFPPLLLLHRLPQEKLFLLTDCY